MSKRPTIYDKAVIKVAATKLLDDVLTWLNDSGDVIDYSEDVEARDSVLVQLSDALKTSSDNDGYKLARELEGEGWDPDARLVEILDNSAGYLREEVRRASAIWFDEQGLMAIPNGTKVKSKQRGDTQGKVGTVIDFHKDGRYTVNFPELGHKDPNDRSPRSGTTGIILDHENLEKVP